MSNIKVFVHCWFSLTDTNKTRALNERIFSCRLSFLLLEWALQSLAFDFVLTSEPCIYCLSPSPFELCSNLYTIQHLHILAFFYLHVLCTGTCMHFKVYIIFVSIAQCAYLQIPKINSAGHGIFCTSILKVSVYLCELQSPCYSFWNIRSIKCNFTANLSKAAYK